MLLFVTRFVARGHLIPLTDQECHIGGIAADVLAHGVRFPLLVYAPNEYDNGSFVNGLLAAASFGVLGRSVLALKLVTHGFAAAGAVAALWLLRGCLTEVGLTGRQIRATATAVLVVTIAIAPRVVTLTATYAVGNHAEGAAIDAMLLAVFARRWQAQSAARVCALWAVVGFAVYVNKGTLLVLPVLAAAELVRARRSRGRLAAAITGFLLGVVPELVVVAQRHGLGWMMMASKAERGALAFPGAAVDSLVHLADQRLELLAAWALALGAGIGLLVRALRYAARPAGRDGGPATAAPAAPPITLALVVSVTCLHLAALTLMAQGGPDAYAIYSYPTLSVLFAVLVAWMAAQAASRWGGRAGVRVGAAAVALTLVLYRPDAVTAGMATVSALWRDRAGAVCSWRFAEGFLREHQYGVAVPGQTGEQHAIERCRSLSEPPQVLDCVGGLARELHWRRGGRVDGAPPDGLSAAERRAYAYHYGTHRFGDGSACRDFVSAELAEDCAAAVQLECLVFADLATRYVSASGLPRPGCRIPEPPMDGYWSAMRAALLARPAGARLPLPAAAGDADLRACAPVVTGCY